MRCQRGVIEHQRVIARPPECVLAGLEPIQADQRQPAALRGEPRHALRTPILNFRGVARRCCRRRLRSGWQCCRPRERTDRKYAKVHFISSLRGGISPSALKPIFLCVPSQYGLFAECPQRHSQVSVSRFSVRPVPETTSRDPLTCSGPSRRGVTVSAPLRVARGWDSLLAAHQSPQSPPPNDCHRRTACSSTPHSGTASRAALLRSPAKCNCA